MWGNRVTLALLAWLIEYMHSLIIKRSNRQYTCLCSETLVFRTSEMQTSRSNRRLALVQIEFPLTAIHYNPWNANTLQFHKADKFFGPFSTWTVHNSLDNADAHLPLMQVCQPQLTNSTTRHYYSIGSHSSSLWSAFLTSIQQGRALEHAFIALNSMGIHCHT